MAGFLTSLFGSKKATTQPAAALRINTSMQGVPRALVLAGRVRIAGNLIDYYGFNSTNAPASGGSKGGATGSGSGKGQTGSYQYNVTFVLALCEGPIASASGFWINGSFTSAPSTPGEQKILPSGATAVNLAGLLSQVISYEFFLGDYAQTPSPYTSAVNPSHALGYRGLAYVLFENFPLGSSNSLPNITTEVLSGVTNSAIPGQPDGDVSIAAAAFLTNPHWGVGFPAARLGSLAQWQSYTLALGLVVSPVLVSPIAAAAFFSDLAKATNSEPCWQDGLLTVIPYGDASVSLGQISSLTETRLVPNTAYPQLTVGNVGTFAGDGGVKYNSGTPLVPVSVYAPTGITGTGSPGIGQYYVSGGIYYFNLGDANATVLITYDWAASAAYTPDTRPLYDFTLDDFMANQGSIGSGAGGSNSPLLCVRKPFDQRLNNIKAKYLDRNNNYNPVKIEQKNEASIVAFKRERPSDLKQLDFFCLASAAQQSIMLTLIREEVACTFQWTCGRHFLLILKLMAIVTVSDPGQGLFRQGVRIKEIKENADFSLTIIAEEFLGTVSAPQFGAQATSGFVINYNVDPGAINPPLIFEPTDQLGGGQQIWGAVSGQNAAVWGGAFIWVTFDEQHYARVGEVIGPARMGVLSADLPAVSANPVGQTIDAGDALAVDLTQSAATLASGTVSDVVSLNTRCYVGGEIVAYETATLTAAHKYNLTYLVRGAYGTETAIVLHRAGTPFARLDANIFEFPFDQSRIGSTISLKFQSFNIYQGGLQDLASLPAYPYTITGSALFSPLPNVQNLRTVFDVNSGFTILQWDDIKDFRPFRYEIRSGTSPAAAVTLGTIAHPGFRVPGDGTYWVAAVSQPVPGRTVYSDTWQNVAISGAVITQNVIKTVDLKALNWPGIFTGGAGIDNALNAIRTGGGNILTDANVLTTPDILNFGAGTSLSGIYYPGDNAFLDIGYVANASVSIKYQPTGVPVGQNILTVGNVLTDPDILGSASTRFINNYPRIQTATTAGGDLFTLGDLFQYPDLYVAAGANWGAWQAFSPGTYQARYLYFSFFLSTIDPSTISYNLALTITITIPARIDIYALTTSAGGATTLTFNPTGAAAAAFNGGGGAGNTPVVQGTIINAQAGDDLVVTAPTLSTLTYRVKNAGSDVVRSIILRVEGF